MAVDTEVTVTIPRTSYDLLLLQRGDDVLQPVVPAGLGGGGLAQAVSVGTTATALPSTALASRKAISVFNNHASAKLYLGFTSGVTTVTGFPVLAQTAQPIDLAEGAVLYGICASGTIDTRVLEVA